MFLCKEEGRAIGGVIHAAVAFTIEEGIALSERF